MITLYNSPPASAIAEAMQIPLEKAKLARQIIRGEIKVTGNPLLPRTNKWIDQCLTRPKRIELIMDALDEVCETFGVVPIWGEDDFRYPVADYLNTGDTYSATILFNRISGTFRITTWGDFFEKNERRYKLK